jgi:uncharacterized protein (TIGR03118 family)
MEDAMRLRIDRARLRTALFAGVFAFALPYSTEALSATQIVSQTNLVTDDAAFLASQGFLPAAHVDANLINPWGMSFSPTSPFWISDQGTGVSTLYFGDGTPAPQPTPLVVTIPSPSGPPSGPTGQVFSAGSGFNLGGGSTAAFIFANLDGSISAWTGAFGTSAAVQVDTPNAVYTGLALGSSGGHNYLYAANHAGGIDVFDQDFAPVTTLPGNFTDPNLPAGLTPFNVANIGGLLYVTYAIAGPDADEAALGQGAVSVFNTDGTFVDSFASGGNLLSPWGITQAPSTFGIFGDAILIGNFAEEDGFINAFASDGTFLGELSTGSDPFAMPYLWDLAFRTGGTGVDPNALYFTAGIGDEEHGLFARLNAVPEPSTWAMMLLGFSAIGVAARRRRRTELTFRQIA